MTAQVAHPRADMADRFRRNILQAGGMVMGADGQTLRPAPRLVDTPAPYRVAEPLPSMIELDEDGTDHTVTIKRRSGERIELKAALRYGAVRDFASLQDETTRLSAALETATDRKQRRQIAAQQLEVEEDLLRLLFPDLPDGLIGDLDPRTVRKLTDLFGAMMQEAIGASADPNGQAGR